MIGVVVLLVHHLGQAEISDFNFATDIALGQEDVAGLQIVVNNRRFDFV